MKSPVSNNFKFTLEASNEFFLFVALMFEALETIELPYRPVRNNREYQLYGLDIPKTKLEIVKLNFAYKPLWKKMQVWADSEKPTMFLNPEEIVVFRKGIECAYEFYVNRDGRNANNFYMNYFKKHFLVSLN